jgi:hypothetical protein
MAVTDSERFWIYNSETLQIDQNNLSSIQQSLSMAVLIFSDKKGILFFSV